MFSGLACAAFAAQAALPPPVVNLRFFESGGLTTTNAGSLGGTGDLIQADTAGFPALVNMVPTGPFTPSGNTKALDMGAIYSTNFGHAVDIMTTVDGTVGTLNQFTIAGWLNARSLAVGPGGNRVAFALNAPGGQGFDLAQLANGALRIGINQWPDGANGGGPTSQPMLTADSQAGASNWVFFAVAYNPTLPTGQQLKYYFGSPNSLASLSTAHNYEGADYGIEGAIQVTGPLTIGNFGQSVAARNDAGSNSRVFRGLIDEFRIFDVALDTAQIQEAQMNGAPPPVAPTVKQVPAKTTVFGGESVTLTVQVSGTAPFTYQWQRNGENIPGETNESYTISSATSDDNNDVFRVIVSNSAQANVASSGTTLTVLQDNGPRVSLSFSEGSGIVTNVGTVGGAGVFAVRDGYPIPSGKVPSGTFAPTDNLSSVDFGPIANGQGARAIDLTNSFGGNAGGMTAFTVAGWVNARDLNAGWGGNRLVFGLAEPGGPGFDVVQQQDGSVRIGVNQWPDAGAGGPISSTDKITADPDMGQANWVFFAVTYDSTLAENNVNYYFGSPTANASLDVTGTYTQGAITRPGQISIGNFGPVAGARNELGPNGGSRVFRGLIDEVNVFGRALSLTEIQALQKAPAYKPVVLDPATISLQPLSQTNFVGQNVTFTAQATGSAPLSYQWWQRQQGTDAPLAGATSASFVVSAINNTQAGIEYWVVVSNTVRTVTSQRVTITALPDNNHKVAMSFTEGSGDATANAGNMQGAATFNRDNGFPVFSTLVPTGQFAPSNNTSSVDFGTIAEGQGGRAVDLLNGIGGTLGSMTGFTVSGWLNARDLTVGWGGNRIVFALAQPDGPGFDLVHNAEGALRLGVNQWPDGANGGGPQSSTSKITADPDTGANNWVFFAVTYDSTLPSGQVSYYFGTPTQQADLDVAADYAQTALFSSGQVTVGNFGPVAGARNEVGLGGGSRVFRGLFDEINIFNKALSLAEIRALQVTAPAQPVVNAPALTFVRQGNQLQISWESLGSYQLQFRDSLLSGTWANENTAPVVSGNRQTVIIQPAGTARFFRLIRK